MAKQERVYLRDTDIWDSIDHEASKEQFPETYADIENVTRGSGKTLVWRCRLGHSWGAKVYSRSNGRGCPFCSGKRVTDSNRLSTNRPELALEWDFDKNDLTPYDVPAYSNKKIWWKCAEGHHWQAKVYNRSIGRGCPFCSGRRTSDANRLSTNRPELAREWDFYRNELTPYDVTMSSGKKYWWVCADGHHWQAQANSRSSGKGCPACARKFGKIEGRFIEAFTEQTDFTVTAHGIRLNQLTYTSGKVGVEVDIILYQNNHYLLVEYDGSYWHREKTDMDTDKSRSFLSLGENILHVRIREDDLPELDLLHDRFAQFRHNYHGSESASIADTVRNIEKWFLEKIGE